MTILFYMFAIGAYNLMIGLNVIMKLFDIVKFVINYVKPTSIVLNE